jgi:anti-repressor protein
MTDLIKITTNSKQQQVVDARELHTFLGSKQKFADWVKAKVVNNPFFTEGEDYALVPNVRNDSDAPKALFTKIDYALTLDTAKKVSMAEQTSKGNEVRDYFIECEKKTLPQSFSQALLLASQQAELIEQQEAKMKLDAPKVDYFDDLIDRELYLSLRDTAKELNQKQKKFNQWLINTGYIYRNPAGKIKPTAKAIEDGSIVLKEFKRKTSSFSGNQTLTTVKGRKTFLMLLEGVTL